MALPKAVIHLEGLWCHQPLLRRRIGDHEEILQIVAARLGKQANVLERRIGLPVTADPFFHAACPPHGIAKGGYPSRRSTVPSTASPKTYW